MTDPAPHIFRSLERRAGKETFDVVVEAAVAAYGSLRQPSERQSRELSRLVAPLWNRVGADTQRAAAAALSHARTMPRDLTELLLSAPVEVSAPFLVSSPALTADDLQRLEASADERVRRIVRSRVERAETAPPLAPAAVSSPVAAHGLAEPAPAMPFVEAPSLVPDLVDEVPAVSPETPPATPAGWNAEGVREALRRMALTGRHAAHEPAPPKPRLEDLLAHAMDRDEDRFYEALGLALDLRAEIVHQMRTETDGERLAVALKALGAGAADAMSVLMMLKPAIGLDVAAFERLTRVYRTLTVEDGRRLLDDARIGSRGTHQPLTAPALRPLSAPRTEFGRRKERPAEDRSTG